MTGSTARGALYTDLMAGTLPQYSFIVPNEIENGHDPASVNGVTIAGGVSEIANIDSYLAQLMPVIKASPDYQSGNLVVMITFDEGFADGPIVGDGAVGENCADPNVSALATSCQVKTWLVGRYVPAYTSAAYMNQFGLLAASQRILGLSPLLGHAADATTPDIVNGTAAVPDPFNLAPTGGAVAPNPPTIGTATPGDGQATVSFTPGFNGGSAIGSYTVTSSPGGLTASGSTSPVVVPGLTNGTAYTFTVTATNVVGTSVPSAASAAVTPAAATPPGAPTALVATAGSSQVSLAWTAPTVTGGSPLTDYVVQFRRTGTTPWQTYGDGVSLSTNATVSGLTGGTGYDFQVSAVNSIGTGVASASVSATPSNQAPELLTDPGFEVGTGGWTAFNVGTFTRVTSPVHGGTNALRVAATAATANLVGMTNNSVVANTVAGQSYTAKCYVQPTTANLNVQIRILEYTQSFSSNIHFQTVTVNALPLNTWSLLTVTSAAVNSGERMIPQIYSTNETTGTGSLVYDDCSMTAGTAAPTPGPPAAPTGIVATPNDSSATVAFTAPASTGGAPVTGYTVTAAPSGIQATGPGSPVVVAGLTNGTAYTFSVTATNANGTSPASVASNSVRPVAFPGPPTGLTATGGDSHVDLTWAAPASTGGSPVTDYVVQYRPTGTTAWTTYADGTSATTAATVSGLSNGTSYDFQVAGVTVAGQGGFSSSATSFTTSTVPGAPTSVTAVANDGAATVAFAAPTSNGGSAVTTYTVTSSPGGFTASGPSSPLTVPGLTNGTPYTFTVVATNGIGPGAASAPSNSVTPAAAATVPGAPTSVTAVGSDGQATVSFSPPVSDGGSLVTGYTVTASPGGLTMSGAASPLTVGGLTNGTAYTFTVVATNGVGPGAASDPSNSVTPAAVPTAPGAPTGVSAVAGDGQATVSFTAPVSNGGSAVTSYTVTSSPGGTSQTGSSSPIIVSTLTNGTPYTFTVVATNGVGGSVPSAASSPVTPSAPATVPGAPTSVTAVAGDGSVTVSFAAPVSNGGSPITGYTVTSSPGGITQLGSSSPITVSTLTNGTAYTFTVVATNGVGPSAASGASNSVTPTPAPTVPGPPTGVSAVAGNASATVSFTAPVSNGGSAVTSYTVTSSPGGVSMSGTSSPISVGGLTNGTAYTFTVKATNGIGSSVASAASSPVTPVAPVTVPGAPTSVTAVGGDGSATVSFSAPASNGGSPITGYTVTSSPGGITQSGSSSPITVSTLTNGTAYTFTVVATNGLGPSAASGASNSVTPTPAPTVPGAPTAVSAVAGNASATVSFTAPASNGGSAVTSYTVTSSPGGLTVSGPASPLTVGGLTNGTAYTFTVKATNGVGSSVASAASNSVTPAAAATVPGAPTAVSAVAGNASATVSFTAPASNGGSAVTSYTVTSSPGGLTVSGPASPLTMGGLTNGTAYTFTVKATNGVGSSVASAASNSVTPAAAATVPGAPTAVSAVAGNASATVSFTAPASNGGSAVTSYTVTSSPGGLTVSGPASPLTVGGLTNGTAYTFTVKATNGVGSSVASAASNSVTPAAAATVPGAPTAVSAVAGSGNAAVSFTAPASNGGSAVTSYTVTSSPGGLTVSGPASPLTVTGLTNGTAYTFTVKATNGVGSSVASAASAAVTPLAQLLPDPGFEANTSGWTAFNVGTLTRVTTPVHGGTTALRVAATTAAANLVGLTQNSVVASSVKGQTYTAQCWVQASSANLNIQIRWLEYTQNFATNVHLQTTTVNALTANTWTLLKVSSVAVNAGERMVPQIYSTNETTATGSITYDDCSVTAG